MRRLKADLTLLLVAVIWGSAFVAQRVAAAQTGFLLFTGLRFLLGGAALFLVAGWIRSRQVEGRLEWKMLPWVGLAGLLLATGSATQQLGIRYTTAGNAGFVTGLYVVLVPVLLALAGRGQPRPVVWLATGLAVMGLFLLSTEGRFTLSKGDAIVFGSAIVWAFHLILVGELVQKIEPIQLSVGQFLVCGFLNTCLGLVFESEMLAGIGAVWLPMFYTGLISVGVGYTLQAVAQKIAPPTDAALILSGEAVFAALSGWLILNERLSPIQLGGCALILVGMVLVQIPNVNSRSSLEDRNAGFDSSY